MGPGHHHHERGAARACRGAPRTLDPRQPVGTLRALCPQEARPLPGAQPGDRLLQRRVPRPADRRHRQGDRVQRLHNRSLRGPHDGPGPVKGENHGSNKRKGRPTRPGDPCENIRQLASARIPHPKYNTPPAPCQGPDPTDGRPSDRRGHGRRHRRGRLDHRDRPTDGRRPSDADRRTTGSRNSNTGSEYADAGADRGARPLLPQRQRARHRGACRHGRVWRRELRGANAGRSVHSQRRREGGRAAL